MPAASDGQPLGPTQASAVALRTAAIPAALVGVAAVVLGWWFKGANGALGAALGAIVALTFFAVGQYVLTCMALNSFGVQIDEGMPGFPT